MKKIGVFVVVMVLALFVVLLGSVSAFAKAPIGPPGWSGTPLPPTPLPACYVSGWEPYGVGNSHTWSHGLGERPKLVELWLDPYGGQDNRPDVAILVMDPGVVIEASPSVVIVSGELQSDDYLQIVACR